MHIYYIFGKELHQSWEVVNQMPFFEVLMVLDMFIKEVKAKNDETEAQNQRYEEQMAGQQSMMRQMQANSNLNGGGNTGFGGIPKIDMPRMDSYLPSNFNLPKI